MRSLSYLISFLAGTSLVAGAVTDTNTSSILKKECSLVSSNKFGYTGDVSGKRIYTKEEFIYTCSFSYSKQGECLEYEQQTEEYNSTKKYNNVDMTYEDLNFQGSMGAMLGLTQTYNKLDNIWGGWKGICQTGADDGNWDWLSDPYIMAGYLLTAVSAGASMYANSATTAAETASGAVNTVGGGNDYIKAIATAKEAGDAAKTAEMINKVVSYSSCAAQAGIDVGKMIDDYQDDGIDCDPVDEFCEKEDTVNDSQVFTVPEEKYNEFLAKSPEMEEYYKVLDGVGTGVLTLKVVKPTSGQNFDTPKEAEEAAQKTKDTVLAVNAAVTSLQLASCVYKTSNGGGASTGSNTGSDESSLLSAQNISTMLIGQINPLAGMAVSMAFNAYNSITSHIDTCDSLSDAKDKGKRHEATYYAKRQNSCHLIRDKKSGNDALATGVHKFYYCCYDDTMTRILVEQLKAQYLQDWQHCTGLTLKELQNMSLKKCSATDMQDGVSLPYDATTAERKQAYQYKHKCVNLDELVNYMMRKFGGEDMLLDESQILDSLDELKEDLVQ